MHVAPRVAPRRLLRRASLLVGLVGLVVLVALSAGCGASATGAGGSIHVVAAENFWGSIAAQLAGTRASVQSIIVAPAQDPHSYEPSAADARALAGAQLVI